MYNKKLSNKEGYKPNQRLLRTFFNNNVKTNPDLSWLKEEGICQKVTEFAFEQLGDSYKIWLGRVRKLRVMKPSSPLETLSKD